MTRQCRVVFGLLLLEMSVAEAPKVKLNDGHEMPAIALGTYLGFDEHAKPVNPSPKFTNIIEKSIGAGWRHIDTASKYGTEKYIGDALKGKIEEGVITRADLFITTKLWNTHHRRKEVEEALRNSLKDLSMDYVDLYLMHWPIALNKDHTAADPPVDFMETWRGLEDVQRLGLARSIGVSNFNQAQVKRLLEECEMKPAVLQIEIHPQMVQKEFVEYAQSQGLVVMGYSPFGSLVMRYGIHFPGPRFTDEIFVKASKKYKKTPAQIALRWQIDRHIVPVPKASSPEHLTENINVFDFSLTEQEVEEFNALNSNTRYNLPSFWQELPHYPYEKIENPVQDPFVNKNEE